MHCFISAALAMTWQEPDSNCTLYQMQLVSIPQFESLALKGYYNQSSENPPHSRKTSFLPATSLYVFESICTQFQNVSLSLAGLLLFHSDSDSCLTVWLIVLFGIFQGHCTHNDGGLPVMLPSMQGNIAAVCFLNLAKEYQSIFTE